MELGRVSTAMVTPFSATGDIDYDKTAKLIEHLIANGSDSLVSVVRRVNLLHFPSKRRNTFYVHDKSSKQTHSSHRGNGYNFYKRNYQADTDGGTSRG